MVDEQAISVSGRVRGVTGAALMASFVAGGGFIAFAWTTTQAKTVRAASPWQGDPYDVVVSFTEFVVPAVLLLMALRMLLWRNNQPQPACRVAQLARTAAAATGLVAMTAAVAVSAGAAVTASQAVGEHWTDPQLVLFAMVTATGGFFGMACSATTSSSS